MWEREVAQRLRHIFPKAQRQLEYQASDCIGVDISGTDVLKIQCKSWAGYTPVSIIKEVKIKYPSDIPVLVTKGINLEPMAVLPFEKFVTLLEAAYGLSPLMGQQQIEEAQFKTIVDAEVVYDEPAQIEHKEESYSLDSFI